VNRLVLLLPRPLGAFILREQAEHLLRSPGAVAFGPSPRVPSGLLGRLPEPLARPVARALAQRLRPRVEGELRAVAIFHPFQLPLAEALLAGGGELWYGRWDRYEDAYDATARDRRRLRALHERAARRSALTFVASDELARLERAAGRDAAVVGLAAADFPAPDPAAAVIAVSLGHLGRRTDWALLRAVGERMPELVLLLIGAWHDDESGHDADYRWCRSAPGFVWLGPRSDEEAARLIACADVGVLPFESSPFNDAGLPYRILKHARLGRRTIVPDLPGCRTWPVTVADGPDAWVAALRAAAGERTRPDAELRAWALAQTPQAVNAPLVERMRRLGIPT
jgi:hypothetical protein